MTKLSVIVPVYNIEKYIGKCIDSILEQTFQDFEVILVDDGSIDSSGEICDDYAKKDSRIKVIHKQNGGLSSARNVGVALAVGKYIGFVDGDDTICKDMYNEMMVVAMREKTEVVGCCINFISCKKGMDECSIWPKLEDNKVYERSDFILNFLPDMKWILMPAVWNKIYARDIFDEIRFPEGKLYEDSFVQLSILNKCNKIFMLKDAFWRA